MYVFRMSDKHDFDNLLNCKNSSIKDKEQITYFMTQSVYLLLVLQFQLPTCFIKLRLNFSSNQISFTFRTRLFQSPSYSILSKRLQAINDKIQIKQFSQIE